MENRMTWNVIYRQNGTAERTRILPSRDAALQAAYAIRVQGHTVVRIVSSIGLTLGQDDIDTYVPRGMASPIVEES
jgi:hypothetical protein